MHQQRTEKKKTHGRCNRMYGCNECKQIINKSENRVSFWTFGNSIAFNDISQTLLKTIRSD